MSVEAMALVLHHSRAQGTAKVVLLGIANHDGDGGAWPTIRTLCKYARRSESAVQEAIGRLVASGELQVHANAGGTAETRRDRRPNRYEILLACPEDCDGTTNHGVRETTPRLLDGVRETGRRGPVSRADGVRGTGPEPSLQPSKEPPSRAPSDYEDDFARVWERYPRRTARKAALKAYQARRREGVDAAELEGALMAYAARVERDGTEERFVMHGATFFGPNERWRDYLTAPATPRTPDDDQDAYDAAVRRALAEGVPIGERANRRAMEILREEAS